MNEPEINVIKSQSGFRLPQFKWPKKPVIIIGTTLFLAAASVVTAWLLYQRRAEPVAPTAPASKPKAAVLPTPAPTPPTPTQCILAFTVLASPGPSPTPTPTPTTSPGPTPTPTPGGTPGPTPTPTPGGTPRPTPTPIAVGPTPTPVTLEEAGSVAGTWTISLAGGVLLILGAMLMLAF